MPGAILLLTANGRWFDFAAPVRRLFGENSVVLAVSFIFLSYLCGHVVDELGHLLESLLSGLLLRISFFRGWIVKRLHFTREDIAKAYAACFPERELPEGDKGTLEGAWTIFRYVQRETRTQRILMFSSFHTMSRSMFVALLFILILQWQTISTDLLIGSGVLMVIFCIRWVRFEYKCLDEALLLCVSKSAPQVENKEGA